MANIKILPDIYPVTNFVKKIAIFNCITVLVFIRLSRNSCQPMITQILEVDCTDNTDDAFNLCNRFFNRCNQGRHFCDALSFLFETLVLFKLFLNFLFCILMIF